MEEEKKKTKEVEIKTKSPMWVVVLVAVLVIALACEFVYIRKLKNINQEQTQIQAEQAENNNSNIEKITDNNIEETKISNKKNNESTVKDINNMSKILGYVNGLEFKDASKISKDNLLNTVIWWHYKEDKVEAENNTSSEKINEIIKQVYNLNYNNKDSYKWEEATPGLLTYIGINEIKEKNDCYEVKYALINLIDADAPDETRGYYKAIFERNDQGTLYIKSNVETEKEY